MASDVPISAHGWREVLCAALLAALTLLAGCDSGQRSPPPQPASAPAASPPPPPAEAAAPASSADSATMSSSEPLPGAPAAEATELSRSVEPVPPPPRAQRIPEPVPTAPPGMESTGRAAGPSGEAGRYAAAMEMLQEELVTLSADADAPVSARMEPAPQGPPEARSALLLARAADGYAVVTVYYGTDRAASGPREPAEWFAGKRGPLSFGTCEVSIPLGHRIGELESPSWLRLELDEDPRKHVVLLGIRPEEEASFFGRLAARVAADPQRRAFVFVHGYNVSFADAARRTAQIAYDIGFRGAPVFYSWPSQSAIADYMADENNAEWTIPNLTRFLVEVVERTPAEDVYLIAHSMGNRPLTRAFVEMVRSRPLLAARVREVILTAPDIDAHIFRRDLVPAMARSGSRLTLYASADDKALQASRKVHGDIPRAGDAGAGIVVLPELETVDATGVDTSFLGHSYFAETRSVLTDILLLVREGRRAADRTESLRPVETVAGTYWRFR